LKDDVQRLFAVALELPEDQRARYLASHTNDVELRREVLSLLAIRQSAASESCTQIAQK
jgi:hypothetical protein